jgi:spore germination protein YaaH
VKKQNYINNTLAFLTFIIVLLCIGCSSSKNNDNSATKTYSNDSIDLSVWTTYWSPKYIENELSVLKPIISEICHFAAYYDHNNEFILPKSTLNTFSLIKNSSLDKNISHYLTIVNDKIMEDGTSSLKDKEILYDLLSDSTSRKNHISSLVSLCLEYNFDGIEIDYERLGKDTLLWDYFSDFCAELYSSLQNKNLKLRIVLEPYTPIETVKLPIGPDYIIMCYNLYGFHSSPGPKADKIFLENLSQKYSGFPGNIAFAIATGGFSWNETGEVISLTEIEALSIIEKYEPNIERDEKSQAINFTYIDNTQSKHEVWYADGNTLIFWIETLKQNGHNNFALWRLSGNSENSLKNLTHTDTINQ